MIKFASPYFFYLLALIPLLFIFYLYRRRHKDRQIQAFGDKELIQQLTASRSRTKIRVKTIFLFSAMGLLILALAGFEIGTKYEQVKIEGVDIVLALDISASMNAQDIQPSRIEKAKFEIGSLLEMLGGDRIALVVFAGNAFIQCPMTSDYSALHMFLDAIETSTTTSAGTNFTEALQTAAQAFIRHDGETSGSSAGKAIIMFSDGEDHSTDASTMIQTLNEQNIRVYTVGVGTSNPVPIPVYDEQGNQYDYKKYNGSVVTTKLEDALLKKLAEETGGDYYPVSTGGQTMKKIYDNVSKLEKTESSQYQFTQFEDRFQFFLIIAFILLTVEVMLSEKRKM
ncbi:VWA domain-containing protein [bacterium]|nr:VWA domain-containing protein [bacterium]